MRVTRISCAVVLLQLASGPAAAVDVDAALDVSALQASSPFDTWLDEGEGKLRFDEDDGPLAFSRAFVELRGRPASTLVTHATLNIQDAADKVIDLTEAFVEWRPVPRTPWRVRSRLGAFYPRLSLENVDPGWSSPYALSASAINTWIGEELRIVGAELRASRVLAGLPGEPELVLEGGAFYGNDPTGALLNWRGWSLHDGQTGITSSLPLPGVAAIEPWIPVPDNSRGLEPFEEIDHNAGFYAGAEWRYGDVFRVKYVHYDNHGDPEALDGLDYAWQTRFDHVGVQVALPGDIGLLGQWIDGLTRMGPDLGPWHVWDSGFDARYVLVTRAFGRHRLSARWDDFDVQPYNDPDKYTNRDDGVAWTASWLFDWSSRLRVGAEYLTIATEHCETTECAWVLGGLPRTSRQSQLTLTLRVQVPNN